MAADPRVQAHAVDDVPGIQPLHFGVGIQLVKIGNAQGQVGVGEQLDRLGLGKVHKQGRDVLLFRPLLEQAGKDLRRLPRSPVAADDDPGRVQVIIQGLALPQEFGAEKDPVRPVLFPDVARIPDRDRRFDHHEGVWVDALDQLNHRFHRGAVKKVLLRVIVRRRGDDHEVRVPVRRRPVRGGP